MREKRREGEKERMKERERERVRERKDQNFLSYGHFKNEPIFEKYSVLYPCFFC